MKFKLLLLSLILISNETFSQTDWTAVGPSDALPNQSIGNASVDVYGYCNNNICIYQGQPTIIFNTMAHSTPPNIYQFNSTTWGKINFPPTNYGSYTSNNIYTDPNTGYLWARINAGSISAGANSPNVTLKYDGAGNWNTFFIYNDLVITNTTSFPIIADSNDSLYIGQIGYYNNQIYQAFVQESDHQRNFAPFGSDHGIVGISPYGELGLTVDNKDTLYVAYVDGTPVRNLHVKYYNKGLARWYFAGKDTLNNQSVEPGNVCLAAYSKNIYLAFIDKTNSEVTVMKYSDAKWDTLTPTNYQVSHLSLAISPTGVPYIAFSRIDNGGDGKAEVRRYNNVTNQWETVGTDNFSANPIQTSSLAFDQTGKLYITYISVSQSLDGLTATNKYIWVKSIMPSSSSSTACTAGASNTGPVSLGSSVTLTSSFTSTSNGNLSYKWVYPSGFISYAKDSIINTVTAVNAGIYTVTITDASGCSSTASTNVTVNGINSNQCCYNAGTGINIGSNQTINLTSTGVTPGSYTNTNLTVDPQGRITSVSNGAINNGFVTSVSIATSNGIVGSVTNSTTPIITLSLGAITPSSVNSSGSITGSNLSGTNTGDQTITLTGDVTGSGNGTFNTQIATNAVTYEKLRTVPARSLVGNSTNITNNAQNISLGTGLAFSGTSLIATNTGTVIVNPSPPIVNTIAKFTGVTSIGNSSIYDNGTNVGIGTTMPVNRLEVVAGFDGDGIALLGSTVGPKDAGLSFRDNIRDTAFLGLATASNAFMSGTSPGDIILGTKSGTIWIGSGAATATPIISVSKNNVVIRGPITVDPNIFFGTGSTGEYIFSQRNTGEQPNDPYVGQKLTNEYGLDFWTNHLDRLTISNNGNVGIGIGTAPPKAKLDVEITSSGDAIVSNSTNGYGLYGTTIDGLAGVRGISTLNGSGVYGNSVTGFGVYGESLSGNGVEGVTQGVTTSTNSVAAVSGWSWAISPGAIGVLGMANSPGYAGYFLGDLVYTGECHSISDIKVKTNITDLSGVLTKLMQLKPKSFNYKTTDFKSLSLSPGLHYGIIAQDIQHIFPDLVAEVNSPPVKDIKTGKLSESVQYLGVDYIELVPLTISAIQEQQQEITDLKAQIELLKSRLDQLEHK